MSIETQVFALRLLAGLSLLGFLFVLFYFILRAARQLDSQLPEARDYLLQLDAQGTVGSRIPLQPITTLGRSESNTVMVDDDFASARHAQILRENGRWWLEDHDSRNGTRLNDEVIAGRTVLTEGDMVGIGRHNYRIEFAKQFKE